MYAVISLQCRTKSLALNRDNYRGNDKLFSRLNVSVNLTQCLLINRELGDASTKRSPRDVETDSNGSDNAVP